VSSPGSNPSTAENIQLIEETRRQINRLFEEVARLAESEMAPPDFYGEFLRRILMALGAPAGAVWGRTAQGNLQLQFQINMREVGYDRTEQGRASHDELLRQMVQQPRALHLPPHSSGGAAAGTVPPGNPTDYLNLLVPILVDNQLAGIIEVWHQANSQPAAIPGFLQFMARMSELATRYMRNLMLRQMVGQQQLWVQLEAFARNIHTSLNPVEVGYQVANEGRRLIECDRVSVGVRYGRKVRVEAISGADVVERRSNLVQLMRKLFDSVIAWGEKLVYNGTKDDTLPPDVLKALDAYLAESNSKLLVVEPLKDEREKPEKENKEEKKKPARSALLMECFEPPAQPEQLLARMEVISRHATPALYNSVEHRRIPMRFLWMPLAKIQEGLGGKARAIITLIGIALLVLVAALIFVPYPLKMDSTGYLLPVTRRWMYSPVQGTVIAFHVEPNQEVDPGQVLVTMFDTEMQKQVVELQGAIRVSGAQIEALQNHLKQAGLQPGDRAQVQQELAKEKATWKAKDEQLRHLAERFRLDLGHPGQFRLEAPPFPAGSGERVAGTGRRRWTVLNFDFREKLIGKMVKPDVPLLRLGDNGGDWEVELKIPQKHIGQVAAAFAAREKAQANADKPVELDVDLLVRSEPTRVYKGKLRHDKVANSAEPNKDEQNEQEPVVYAYVRISGDGIADDDCVIKEAPHLLVSGTEAHTKIRCGNHAMGYSLFYGVWEFLYEKVVFFF
jgi:hypothetical protein